MFFFSSNPNPSNKVFSITLGDLNYLEETGHFYEFISAPNILWTAAKTEAEDLNYFGLQGYLATIRSEAENQIAAVQINDVGWIGASDATTEGDWRWVTGPEGLENGGTGVPFWSGLGPQSGGSPVNGEYSNWNNEPNASGQLANEPNNSSGEDYAHVTSPNVGLDGSWNDLDNETQPSGDYQAKGYIVEYGGMPGEPTDLYLSTTTSLFAPPSITLEPFLEQIVKKYQ